MSTTRHLVALASLAFAFGTGVSQELPAPQLAVGERWTYQTYDRQFDEGAFTIEVTEQTANGYSLLGRWLHVAPSSGPRSERRVSPMAPLLLPLSPKANSRWPSAR